MPVSDPDFVAVQHLVMAAGYGDGEDRLSFEPEAGIDAAGRAAWLRALAGAGVDDPCGEGIIDRRAFARAALAAGLI